MGKYGGLSGQYYFKTKAEGIRARNAARKTAKEEVAKGGKGYIIRLSNPHGIRGFWELDITKKRKRK